MEVMLNGDWKVETAFGWQGLIVKLPLQTREKGYPEQVGNEEILKLSGAEIWQD